MRRYVNQQAVIKQEVTPELFTSDEELNITDKSETNSDNNNVNVNTKIFKNYYLHNNEPFQDQISSEMITNSQFLWIIL